MNIKSIHHTVLFLLVMIFSCKNNNDAAKPLIIIPEGLELNNGQKWISNKETHIGMKRIDSILKHNPSLDGKVLGNALSTETSYIIKSCNMEGEAHDQLHIVLVPILEEITEIKDITDTEKLVDKVSYIKGLVNTYFEYFKT